MPKIWALCDDKLHWSFIVNLFSLNMSIIYISRNAQTTVLNYTEWTESFLTISILNNRVNAFFMQPAPTTALHPFYSCALVHIFIVHSWAFIAFSIYWFARRFSRWKWWFSRWNWGRGRCWRCRCRWFQQLHTLRLWCWLSFCWFSLRARFLLLCFFALSLAFFLANSSLCFFLSALSCFLFSFSCFQSFFFSSLILFKNG